MLYIQDVVAHSFLSLCDNSEAFYQMTEFHQPYPACGVRWNDPVFGIAWPIHEVICSERGLGHSDFEG